MTDLVERLRGPAPHMIGPLIDEAADEIERLERLTARQEGLIERLRIELAEERAKPKLMAEHDDYVIRANANVCELNRDIERLRAHINTLIQERDAERQTYNDAIARHLSEIKRLQSLAYAPDGKEMRRALFEEAEWRGRLEAECREAADKIELLLEETKLMRAAPRKQSDEIERRGRLMDGDAAEIMRLLREIERLKAQLARTETALDNEFNNGIALCADIERLQKI